MFVWIFLKWRSSLLREHFPFIRSVLLAIKFLCCAVKSMHTRHAHICRGFELFIILQVNLSQNCWNSGIVRKFRCQNHSSFNGFHWKIHKHTALDLKWIRVKFQWNVVHLVDTTPIFSTACFSSHNFLSLFNHVHHLKTDVSGQRQLVSMTFTCVFVQMN